MELTAQEIDQYLANEKKEVQYQREKIDELAAYERNLDIDHARLDTKATLKYLTDEYDGAYAKEAKEDPKLKKIIDKVWFYADMDVTAVNGNYEQERELLMEIKKLVDDYMIEMDQKMLDKDLDDDPKKTLEKEVFRKRYLIGANLQNLIDGQMNGSLVVDSKAFHINAVKTGDLPKSDDRLIDAKDMPLFPHDPSPNDIAQGYLGDCYMVAGLSTLATRFPNKIKDSIVDNGDGTVTVRFFRKKIDEETGIQQGHEPVFVTVDKKYPETKGSSNCLWVQMLERAYAASRLHPPYADSSPMPEDLKERYQELLEKRQRGEKLPTHEDCPWLIDVDNNLQEWKTTYSMIEGGNSHRFLERFLGDDGPGEAIRVDKPWKPWNQSQFFMEAKSKISKNYKNLDEEFEKVVTGVLEYVDNLQIFREKHLMMGKAQKMVIDLLNGVSQTAPKNASEGMKRSINTLNESAGKLITTPVFQSNKEAILRIVNDMFDKEKRVGKNGKGVFEYGREEKKTLKQIEENISLGNIVNAGSRGSSDTKNDRGILGHHAYSVLGITRHSLYEGGPEFTFVRLRNPHGKTGCRYYVNSDTKEVKRYSQELRETGGIFEIELKDFCHEFASVYVNHVSPEMIEKEWFVSQETKQERIHKKQENTIHKIVTFQSLREMARPLHDAMKGLEETEGLFASSSPEYETFRKNMDVVMKGSIGNGYWEGRTISAINKDIQTIIEQGKDYLEHCKQSPRSGSRRETRVREVSRIVNCFEAYKEGMTPADYTRKKIAENLYEAGLEGQKAQPSKTVADPAVREKIIEGIRNSTAFKTITETADFEKLSDLTIDSGKTYKLYADTMEKLMMEQAVEDARLVNIDKYIENEQKEVQRQREEIDKIAEGSENFDIDRSRLDTKATLKYLTQEEDGAYTIEAKEDPQLKEIIDKVREYANTDVTAIGMYSEYEDERELLVEMKKKIDDYMTEMDQKMLDQESENEGFRKRYLVGANLQNFIDGQMNGSLVVDSGAVHINAVKTGCLPKSDDKLIDAKDMPLFPHDPSPNDLAQGGLGDCYLVSGLSTLATRFPNKIQENMVDNGDGTVTVRFFRKKIDEATGEKQGHEPVFVTVDKIFPEDNGTQKCLWAQMLERAYAASGLHQPFGDINPIPEDLKKRYQELLEMQKQGKELPTHEECPWLIDSDNHLKEWKPTYSMIESGKPNQFLEHFLGSDAPGESININPDLQTELISDLGKQLSGEYKELEVKMEIIVTAAFNIGKSPKYAKSQYSMLQATQLATDLLLNENNDVAKDIRNSPVFQRNPQAVSKILNDVFDKWKEVVRNKEQNTLKLIEDNIDQGNIVNAITEGSTDAENNRGLLGRHAYSVLGITRHSLYEGGPELTFVRLRNPHGRTGCVYHVDPQTKEITRHSAGLEDTGGIFEITLEDFSREFNGVCVNHVSPEMIEQERFISQETKQERIHLKQEKAREEQVKQANSKKEEEPITLPKIREIARPLRRAMRGLEETEGLFAGASPEYNAFMARMKDTMRMDFGEGFLKGKYMSQIGRYFGRTVELGQAYLEHCKTNPRSESSRETRVKEVSRIVNCCKAYEKGMTPADYARRKIAENLYETGMEKQNAQNKVVDSTAREKAIDGIMNSPIFKKITEEADLEKLSDMTIDSEKTYKLFVVTMKKQLEETAAEDERQAAGAQHAKADVQQKEVEQQLVM